MKMFVEHPKDKAIINIYRYSDIRCCDQVYPVIKFYEKPYREQSPDYRIKFETPEERDAWYEELVELATNIRAGYIGY